MLRGVDWWMFADVSENLQSPSSRQKNKHIMEGQSTNISKWTVKLEALSQTGGVK
jgi:hypothetical protein